eukprot:scaffold207119_cov28-Tisochrysis_lutea.AAC.2
MRSVTGACPASPQAGGWCACASRRGGSQLSCARAAAILNFTAPYAAVNCVLPPPASPLVPVGGGRKRRTRLQPGR